MSQIRRTQTHSETLMSQVEHARGGKHRRARTRARSAQAHRPETCVVMDDVAAPFGPTRPREDPRRDRRTAVRRRADGVGRRDASAPGEGADRKAREGSGRHGARPPRRPDRIAATARRAYCGVLAQGSGEGPVSATLRGGTTALRPTSMTAALLHRAKPARAEAGMRIPNGAAARAASRGGDVRPCRRVRDAPWAYRPDGARPVPAVAGATGTGSSSWPTTGALCECFFDVAAGQQLRRGSSPANRRDRRQCNRAYAA
jgi:hypothetical protein